MSENRTIKEVIEQLPKPIINQLEPPPYVPSSHNQGKFAFAVSSMKDHMSDEGWQIMQGLYESGYKLCGYNLSNPETNVKKFLCNHKPRTLVVQDKREWDVLRKDFREREAQFTNIGHLGEDNSIFKVTILKDAHQRPEYHSSSARRWEHMLGSFTTTQLLSATSLHILDQTILFVLITLWILIRFQDMLIDQEVLYCLGQSVRHTL